MIRATIAGLLAIAVSAFLELYVLGRLASGPMRELLAILVLAVLMAPCIEEAAKRLAANLLRAGWGGTGLVFGLYEGLGKLDSTMVPEVSAILGGFASVAFHWGLGRVSAPAQWPLGAVILLHAGYNGLGVAGQQTLGDISVWVMSGLAFALLAISFRYPKSAPARAATY